MNMMEIAVWIIAILEIVRAVQNAMQLRKSRKLLQMHAKANADLERTMTDYLWEKVSHNSMFPTNFESTSDINREKTG